MASKATHQGITVAYDAKRAVCNMTGLGNYSRLVIGTMAAMYPAHIYKLMTPRIKENPRLDPILMRENVELVAPESFIGRHLPALWRSLDMAADLGRMGVDLYHGLSNEIPLGPMPCASVVTIHDLIWRRVPSDYAAVDRLLYDFKYGRSARRATRIIAISECTKADIVKDWKIDPERIDVIYQGVDPVFSRMITVDERVRIREKYDLPPRYIVAVGTVQSRKNQMLAVRALPSLPADVMLVIVGGANKEYKAAIEAEIGRLGIGSRVKWLVGVPFDDLPALYACATLSSYTSRYEGFGLPVVESLSVGTPVVACTGSCLEEAGGGGALYVAPDDVRGYVEAASSIIEKAYLHDRLTETGRRYIKRFNSSDFATAIMKTYNKALFDFSVKNAR